MTPLLISAFIVFILVTLTFALALAWRDNRALEVAYGLIFIAVALITFFLFSERALIQAVVTVLVIFWGIRLSARVFLRNRLQPEDRRYAAWREEWKAKGRFYFVFRTYFQVFLLQGLIGWLVSLPIILVNASPAPYWNLFATIGVIIWCIGFVLESVADYQLDRFKRNPENKGRVMTRGLFRFSRRPNYFGEALMWWGLAVVALSNPFAWIAILSPAIITYIVVTVTGPITEKVWEENEEYQDYKKRTSYFVPWFPKDSV